MFRSAPSSLPLSLSTVSIRPAYPDDAAALERLARLDSQRPLTGRVVVAERDGRLRAALALDSGKTLADPFSPTADLVGLLRVHAAESASARGRRDILRRVGPAALAR